MSKNTDKENVNVVSFFDEHGKSFTELVQEWINENYFFWNCNKEKTN